MKVITENYIENIADFEAWSGGKDTLDGIIELGLEDELTDLMNQTFEEECTDTELNDWLWFDRENIYESLGLDQNGEKPDNEPIISDDEIYNWLDEKIFNMVKNHDESEDYKIEIINDIYVRLYWYSEELQIAIVDEYNNEHISETVYVYDEDEPEESSFYYSDDIRDYVSWIENECDCVF